MTVVFFASIRERVGVEELTLDLPDTVTTVGALADHLSARDDAFKEAFSERFFVRSAVNQVHSDWDTAIKQGDEVAFFPPITGG